MLLFFFSSCFPVGWHPRLRWGPQLAHMVSLCHMAQIRNRSLFLKVSYIYFWKFKTLHCHLLEICHSKHTDSKIASLGLFPLNGAFLQVTHHLCSYMWPPWLMWVPEFNNYPCWLVPVAFLIQQNSALTLSETHDPFRF